MSAPSCPGGVGQHAGQQVGGDDGEAAGGVDRARSPPRQSTTAPVEVGRLNSAPKQPSSSVVDVADDELDADRLGPRAQHGDRLRVGVVVDDEAVGRRPWLSRRAIAIASAAAVASSSSEALATGSPVSSVDHRLEVEQRLQPALADLGLVRRVGRVPRRVLEHVALDHRRA